MNKKQIKFFEDEVVRYMELFGLGRWSVQFMEWDPEDTGDACVMWYIDDRLVKFSVNPKNNMNDTQLSRTALHEVTHVLTCRLAGMTEDHYEAAVLEEIEAIAKAMERAFFGMVDR